MKLSPWLPIPSAPYCCARIVEGGDINDVSDRIAFIEKTPRIRIRDEVTGYPDWLNWAEGSKGAGGSGDPETEQLYGFYPPSRQWCDDMLKLLGYELA